MDPILGGALIGVGGDVLGGLASYFGNRGGYNDAKKMFQGDRRGLLGMLGKDVLNPTGILSQLDAASFPQLQQQAGYISRAGGNLNSSDALGALFERLQGGRNSLLAQLMQTNQLGKADRDLNIRQQLLSGSAANLARY